MTYWQLKTRGFQLGCSSQMAFGTVHYVKPWPRRSEAATGVILQQDIPDYLRNVVYHFPVTDTVDDLTLLEPRTQGIQGIQLTLVYSRSGTVATRKIECVREDNAEGGTEGRDHIYPGQVWGCAYVIQRSQDSVSGPGRRRLKSYITSLSVGGILDRGRDHIMRHVAQSQELSQPVAKASGRCELGYGGGLQTGREGILGKC